MRGCSMPRAWRPWALAAALCVNLSWPTAAVPQPVGLPTLQGLAAAGQPLASTREAPGPLTLDEAWRLALSASPMLDQPWNWICGGLVVFTGALYFADNGMKTHDKAFKGFPACWNMVVFGLMLLSPSQGFTIAVVLACCVFTFMPVRFVHPVRVKRWRPLTLAMTIAWLVIAGVGLFNEMSLTEPQAIIFALSSLYLLTVSALHQALERYF